MSEDLIPIARPTLGEAEERAVLQVLRSGWVGQGPATEAFEGRLCEITGAAEAVAVASGTAALHLVLAALGLGAEDEVLVPASSFVATANAVRLAGARPVFVDVDPSHYNMDPADAARRITRHTRALLVAHQLGTPADLDALASLAEAHGLCLVEDAACALGSVYRGVPVGRPHGAAAVFSFHPRKVITTGEGGAITTRDRDLAERLRRLRNHGMRTEGGGVQFVELGYNYRLDDLSAAVGLAQLDRLPALLVRRAQLAEYYYRALRDCPAVALPRVPPGATSNWQAFQLLLTDRCPVDPPDVAAALAARGVDSRPGLTALHRLPLYRGACPGARPGAERIAARGLFLPLYPDMTDAQAARVVDALRAAVDCG